MTALVNPKAPQAQTLIKHTLDHITQALDPKALDVYPQDAIEQALDVCKVALEYQALDVSDAQDAQRDIEQTLDHLLTVKKALDASQAQDAQRDIEQDHIEHAFDYLEQAQVTITRALNRHTNPKRKTVKTSKPPKTTSKGGQAA